MLNIYAREQGRLIATEDDADAAWLDLIDPTDDERAAVNALIEKELPDTEDVDEIEASARSYVDEAGLHIRSLFLHDVDGRPRNTSVAFTLAGDRLITLREREIPAFRLLRRFARRDAEAARDTLSIVLNLFEIKIDDLADTLEEVYQGLETVSAGVLEETDSNIEDALDSLAHHEDANGKVRLCLMDTQRALGFLLRYGHLNPDQSDRVRALLRDIESLLPHNSFVFDKINFLINAAQGFINIQQNQIIKIFSIAAVILLPPTLVASIYGMNFRHMPELEWLLGYPWALVLMVIAGITPYVYFKRKGWL
jgi:magnesium transporter